MGVVGRAGSAPGRFSDGSNRTTGKSHRADRGRARAPDHGGPRGRSAGRMLCLAIYMEHNGWVVLEGISLQARVTSQATRVTGPVREPAEISWLLAFLPWVVPKVVGLIRTGGSSHTFLRNPSWMLVDGMLG